MALSRRTGQRFQASIWPGFVDAMTGLLLVLMFVLTIFMVVQFVLSETITGQETELDALSVEVAALAQALGLEQQENEDLEQRVGGLQATLTSARSEAEQQAALISSLTAEREAQDIALQDARTRITSFEAQVAALIADRDSALGTIADLEGRRDELLSEQESLNVALASARSEMDAQVEAARLAAAQREALEAMIADLNKDLAAETDARTDLETALSEEEKARLAEAAAAEALREKLLNADAELTAMTLSLEAQRKKAEDTLTLLAAAEVAQKDLDLKLAAALVSGENVETDLASALASLELARSDIIAKDQEIASTQVQLAAALLGLEQADLRVSDLQGQLATLQTELATSQAEAGETATQLTTNLEALETQLAAALEAKLSAESRARTAEETGAALEDQLAAALAAKLAAEVNLTAQGQVEKQLASALAAKLAAEREAEDNLTAAQEREALLSAANLALDEEQARSAEGQRLVAVLNQQVAALRSQLTGLQALLDDSKDRDQAAQVQLQTLGQDLNAALARAAVEERKRRQLEEEERKRLEAEAAALKDKTRDLEKFRSEFFGRLRDVLGAQEGVRIVGDRFVFSSEVLFGVGSANLSDEGKAEIAKVADILARIAGEIPAEIDWILRVDGHTDNQAFFGNGKYADNWELSQGRALSVVRYMIDGLGIPPERLAANGFGEFQPLDPALTPEARAKNRRIELKFTEK
ncbi:peptidoglycan -binding protein [Shimia thalassica]|uniref:peptidoglycan -binding protein n=1 Tax=Shimia thalassica TaxID=1715693 RepID=UPI0026E2D773|nr:peptidoglycan -binding protein [Shimia thalassica]MDO6484208.1 peptidoglycan -binding protein [Shimia thalassica]MDO6799638.1 peptidoglycan -binding protein [Shimia thalassica]